MDNNNRHPRPPQLRVRRSRRGAYEGPDSDSKGARHQLRRHNSKRRSRHPLPRGRVPRRRFGEFARHQDTLSHRMKRNPPTVCPRRAASTRFATAEPSRARAAGLRSAAGRSGEAESRRSAISWLALPASSRGWGSKRSARKPAERNASLTTRSGQVRVPLVLVCGPPLRPTKMRIRRGGGSLPDGARRPPAQARPASRRGLESRKVGGVRSQR